MNFKKYDNCVNQVNSDENVCKNCGNSLNQNISNINNQENEIKKKKILNIFKVGIYICIGFALGVFTLFFKEIKEQQFNNVTNNNGNINNVIKKNNYVLKLKEDKPIKIICDEIKDAISYSNNGFFITSSGDIYRFNSNKLFSNNKNCIKTEFGNNNLLYILGSGIYDKNNNEIYIIYENEIITKDEYNQSLSEEWKELIERNPPFTETSNYDLASINCEDDNETILIKNNIVYGLEHFFKKEDEWLEIGRIPIEEKIIYLNNSLIKTNKAYWNLTITNKEECNKYVDIKCEKKIVKNSLTEIYDEIIFATGNLLIDKDYYLYEKKECLTLK